MIREAYSRLSKWTQVGSFVVMGDLSFSPKIDIARLRKAFRILREIKSLKSGFEKYTMLMMGGTDRMAM